MKKFFMVLAVILTSLSAMAQEAFSSYSPYSMFGIGQLESINNQNAAGMGGIGVGVRDNSFINLLNPASVTAREEHAFMLDFGLKHSDILFSGADSDGNLARSAKNLFNIDHIAVSFPIYKNSAFRLGVMPYSNTGYAFTFHEDDDNILSTLGDVQYFRSGQGGINQMFAGAGVTFFDQLSLGIDGIYYLGTINRSTNTYFPTSANQRTATRSWTLVPRGFSGKVGLQYEQPVGDGYSLTVGLTYKFRSTLKTDYKELAVASGGNYTDTTLNISYQALYKVPQEFAAGFSFRRGGSWMFGFDYTRQDWRGTVFEDTPGVNFSNGVAQSFNAGMEIIPNRYDVRYYLRTVTYRIGAYHKQQYMVIDGHQVSSTGITLGFSLPVYNRRTSVSFALDLGQTAAIPGRSSVLVPGNVREHYFKLSLGLNLYDVWFQKVLYN